MTAVIMMVLSGCSSSQTVDVSDPVIKATSELMSIDPEILQAQNILQQQCARGLGFDVPIDYSAIPSIQGYADVGGIFRSEQEATSVGYGIKTISMDSRVSTVDSYLDSLTHAEQLRYEKEVNGDISDSKEFLHSCAARSYAILFGSYQRSNEVLNTFNELIQNQSKSALEDSDVQTAISEKYVPCMADAGYNVRGLRAGDLARQRFGTYRDWNDSLSDEERDMARQDYMCQREAELIEHIDIAMERNAGKWMMANEAKLLERYEILGDALRKANQVISGQYSFDMYI
ncbi:MULTISPECIES: hypothetical protein [unclassified Bifidobacterium]|uniref:hypothetical protein n=1 Tax=unclassified Bifidobacterium TaxID=2608897 RepID=UPI00112CF9C3|nr:MULTISPECIES: hypothetical protein [unclassified Bifidobacterium]